MRPPRLNKSKSKQIIKYVYRYAIEKYATQNIESMIPYGEIGMILWEVGHQIYEVMQSATDEDRSQILDFVHQATDQQIQEEAEEVIEDIGLINAVDLPKASQEQVVRGIYQTLRAMPNHRISTNQLAQQINQSLFQGHQVIAPRQINPYQSKLAKNIFACL